MSKPWSLAILAHNEESRIAACLRSLPLGERKDTLDVHVMVNGSTDQTAEIVAAVAEQHRNVFLHKIAEGDKCNAWNVYVHDVAPKADVYFFMDGDAEIASGSLDALAAELANDPRLNAAAALPLNGRDADRVRFEMLRDHGLYGDLYALSSRFIARMRKQGIRLPVGKVGDDSLIGALAATDVQRLSHWDRTRIAPCPNAGFYCEPVNLLNHRHLHMQFKRMVRYSIRYFEIKMMQRVLRDYGPEGLPGSAIELHRLHPDVCNLQWRGVLTVFDWLAIKRIRKGLSNAG